MTECGLYLHIPFCERRCTYCDFYSNVSDDETRQAYVDMLCSEIEGTAKRFSDAEIGTIYVGGGTPSLLTMEQLDRIFSTVYKCFSVHSKETTIEVNPNSSKNIDLYPQLGIDRISFGVQSLQEKTLRLLGRLHTAQEAIEALERATRYFQNISGDLIIGIEKDDDIRASVEGLAPFVTHISGYILTIPPKTEIARMVKTKELILATDDESADQYDLLYEVCKEYGFYRYETSNFAKLGYEGKHNGSYWTLKPYLGLGASAHSYYNGIRFFDTPDCKQYLKGIHTGNKKEKTERSFSKDAEKTEMIMLALRTTRGLVISEYNKRFHADFLREYRRGIDAVKKYIAVRKDRLYILPQYFSVQNTIITSILTD